MPYSATDIASLTRDDARRLTLAMRDGESFEQVRVLRCFPWSCPEAYISIRNTDDKELVLVESIEALPDDVRTAVEEELAETVFNPLIQKIVRHRSEFGVITIEAETSRGPVEFQIPSRDHIQMLSATRGLLRDADGNTFEIPDLTALDPVSQKFLHEYL